MTCYVIINWSWPYARLKMGIYARKMENLEIGIAAPLHLKNVSTFIFFLPNEL